MTAKEAIQILSGDIHDNCPKSVITALKHNEAAGMAIEALEKQIPKKPTLTPQNYFSYGECSCGEHLHSFTWKYCPVCGQRVDWEGSEEL